MFEELRPRSESDNAVKLQFNDAELPGDHGTKDGRKIKELYYIITERMETGVMEINLFRCKK